MGKKPDKDPFKIVNSKGHIPGHRKETLVLKEGRRQDELRQESRPIPKSIIDRLISEAKDEIQKHHNKPEQERPSLKAVLSDKLINHYVDNLSDYWDDESLHDADIDYQLTDDLTAFKEVEPISEIEAWVKGVLHVESITARIPKPSDEYFSNRVSNEVPAAYLAYSLLLQLLDETGELAPLTYREAMLIRLYSVVSDVHRNKRSKEIRAKGGESNKKVSAQAKADDDFREEWGDQFIRLRDKLASSAAAADKMVKVWQKHYTDPENFETLSPNMKRSFRDAQDEGVPWKPSDPTLKRIFG